MTYVLFKRGKLMETIKDKISSTQLIFIIINLFKEACFDNNWSKHVTLNHLIIVKIICVDGF
jgi:hypothetical protein